jgi:hypothetical protein
MKRRIDIDHRNHSSDWIQAIKHAKPTSSSSKVKRVTNLNPTLNMTHDDASLTAFSIVSTHKILTDSFSRSCKCTVERTRTSKNSHRVSFKRRRAKRRRVLITTVSVENQATRLGFHLSRCSRRSRCCRGACVRLRGRGPSLVQDGPWLQARTTSTTMTLATKRTASMPWLDIIFQTSLSGGPEITFAEWDMVYRWRRPCQWWGRPFRLDWPTPLVLSPQSFLGSSRLATGG